MKPQGFWSQERPRQLEFVIKYREMIQRARRGEIGILEAYIFHTEHRFRTYQYPSVVLQVTKTQGFPRTMFEISSLIREGTLSRGELEYLRLLIGGMKYYSVFKEVEKYFFSEEIEAEKEKIKKIIATEKKRHALK